MGYVVGSYQESQSKHADNGVSMFVSSRVFKDRESAERESSRLEKIFTRAGAETWFRGMFIREVDWS